MPFVCFFSFVLSKVLFATDQKIHDDTPSFSSIVTDKYALFDLVDRQILVDLVAYFTQNLQQSNSSGNIAGALSIALCYANSMMKQDVTKLYRPRIFIISASDDAPIQYIPVMNCIFSAQKLGIPVDACVLGTEDSVYLQQATNITQGIYARIDHLEDLGSYLMVK